MGQRSQIYLTWKPEKGEHILIARYFQWNFAERMISRATALIAHLAEGIEYSFQLSDPSYKTKMERMCDVNFDMGDITLSHNIIDEYREYGNNANPADWIFRNQDNNDGQLYLAIIGGKIKYGFLDSSMESKTIMDANQYMNWDYENWKEDLDKETKDTCIENIKYIQQNALLMTADEINEIQERAYAY